MRFVFNKNLFYFTDHFWINTACFHFKVKLIQKIKISIDPNNLFTNYYYINKEDYVLFLNEKNILIKSLPEYFEYDKKTSILYLFIENEILKLYEI